MTRTPILVMLFETAHLHGDCMVSLYVCLAFRVYKKTIVHVYIYSTFGILGKVIYEV